MTSLIMKNGNFLARDNRNPRAFIKEVQKLRKREFRDKSGEVIVEGYPEVSRAVKAGVEVSALYICPEIFQDTTGEFSHLLTTEVTYDEFASIAFGDRLKGILAVCRPRVYRLADLLPFSGTPLFIVLEGVEKPGNLGTVIRSSDGAGVTAIIVCDGKTDVYNHNVVRSSIGTVFTVPTVSVSSKEAITFLKKNSVKIFAATSNADQNFAEHDFRAPCAIAVGNEHAGLSELWIAESGSKVKIPMMGEGKCLNVAVSASVLVYEALRQRQT